MVIWMTIPLKVKHNFFSGCFHNVFVVFCFQEFIMYPDTDLFGLILLLVKFTQVLESVDLCLSPNLGSFQHYLFFQPCIFLLSFWGFDNTNVISFFLFHKFCSFFWDLFLSSNGIGLGILISRIYNFHWSLHIFYFFADTFYFTFVSRMFMIACSSIFIIVVLKPLPVRSLQHLCYLAIIMWWASFSMQGDISMVLHLMNTFELHWFSWIRLDFAWYYGILSLFKSCGMLFLL